MRYGRGEWYGWIFFLLAIMVVYADKLLDWVSDGTGWVWRLRHFLVFEVVTIGAIVLTTILLTPHYPKLQWWHPLIYIAMIGLFRVIHRLVVKLFNFDD